MARRANRRANRPQANRVRKHETLEKRVVMSADPLVTPTALDAPQFSTTIVESESGHDPNADFWLDSGSLTDPVEDLGQEIEQTLADAHDQTGQDQVVSNYGFDGSGQTVAVIDSGIAYSHTALGGGLGEDYRVVGGWDFTENDADFYDDNSSAGAHGTHVAGIVGADGDGSHSGVATGVDLVGLRVFDDNGNGYFSWVEDALDWVYENRNAFENPITAVNLSIGTTWNSDSIPSWAMLEDEFAALESVGIFVSVSAGNDYTSYNSNGLSYPAASDHVIPVMSTDSNGGLSYFSQRTTYAIAAPGRSITSTVPDYAANDGDTIDDDWLTKSGTSMAAPYVTGSSVLIREAMEFVGMTDIDQWDIYDHMMSTGDTFYDSTSGEYYTRLNLEAAIDALMPTDDFGSSVEGAYSLGSLDESSAATQTSGVISTLADGDYFSFTADVTGTVTFDAANATHDLVAQWDAWGGAWNVDETGACVLDVVAGELYTIALSSSDGLGYYDLTVSVEATTITPIDLGAISAQQTESGLSVGGEQWFRLTAANTGYLTADLLSASDQLTLTWYDSQQNLISTTELVDRTDASVNAGEEVWLRVAGDASSFDLRLTNALSVTAGVATLVGTTGNDAIEFTAGSTSHTIDLNGVAYAVAAADASTINLSGGAGGFDTVTLNDSAGDDEVVLRPEQNDAYMVCDGLYAYASGFDQVNAFATAGGDDTVVFHDTADSDTITLRAEENDASMTAGGVHSCASGFERVTAYSTEGGYDTAIFHDTAGDDWFVGEADRARLGGTGFLHEVLGFDQSIAIASTGNDSATFYDSAGDDWFLGEADRARMGGSSFLHDARGFDRTVAFSTAGYDQATFSDSTGDDTFVGWSDRALMTGEGFYHDTRGFSSAVATSTSGQDRALLYDSVGDDTVVAWPDRMLMTGDGFYNDTRGFALQEAYASEGYDRAVLHDSAGDDHFVARVETATIWGDGYTNRVWGFDHAEAFATTGNDSATLYDSAGDDWYVAREGLVRLWSTDYYSAAHAFDQSTSFSSSGVDRATFYDSIGDDTFVGWSDRALMTGAGFFHDTRGFSSSTALATGGGADRAILYDSAGNDSLTSWHDRTILGGSGFTLDARGFEQSQAYASTGNDTAVMYDSSGDDVASVGAWGAAIEGLAFDNEAHDFDDIELHAINGGTDSSTVDSASLDYIYSLEGGWT